MTVARGYPRRWTAALVFVGAIALPTSIPRRALAEPGAPAPAPPDVEPRCHRDEDVACTLVRETSAGVWVWTERFRASEPASTGWALAVGEGPISPLPSLSLPIRPAARATPNGAPILE